MGGRKSKDWSPEINACAHAINSLNAQVQADQRFLEQNLLKIEAAKLTHDELVARLRQEENRLRGLIKHSQDLRKVQSALNRGNMAIIEQMDDRCKLDAFKAYLKNKPAFQVSHH